MTDERYQQLMRDVGMPNSRSLLQALQQVANEVGQQCASDKRVLDDLAQLVARLARTLRKAAPDNELAVLALDYLINENLCGSPLRDTPNAALCRLTLGNEMNTKTDQISRGLVAHIAAFKKALNGTRGDLDAWLECNDESEVRQAIFGVLSDAEAIINDLNNLVIAENQRKQQFEAEVAAKDAEIMEQCRLNGMGAEREATLIGKVAQQSAALKLARQVLMSVKETSSSTRLRRIVDEPLAAINEVLGEVK